MTEESVQIDEIENDQALIGPALPTVVEEERPFGNAGELPYETLNGYPMYQEGHVIDGRCRVYERIGWDDRKGATYLAMAPDGKELVIRIGNDTDFTVKKEAGLLCKADQENLWTHFSQVHSIWNSDDYTFLALYFRGGPSLKQCFDFSKGKFTHGSAGRLAADVFEILHVIHKLGYLARNLDLEAFHFDACSRHLFMADISSLLKDPAKMEGETGKEHKAKWEGGELFAPMTFHDGDNLTSRDELEAWFYQFAFLVNGTLPWHGDQYDDVKWNKIKSVNSGKLFANLPTQYKKIYDIITKKDTETLVAEEEYASITGLLKEIYTDVGGVADHDDNFDFEREPTADELPRFVMEKIPTAEADGGTVAENEAAEGNENEATEGNEDGAPAE